MENARSHCGAEGGVRQALVARGGGDVEVAHQTLDDVDVLTSLDEARGIGVAPAVREVLTGDSGLNATFTHEFMNRRASVLPTGAVVERVVEEEGRRREFGRMSSCTRAVPCQQLRDWNDEGFPSSADQ